MKYNEKLEELTKEIIKNLKYNPNNWIAIDEKNGYHELTSWVRTKDWNFVVFEDGKISKPYDYKPSENLIEQILEEVTKIKERDKKQIVILNKGFIDKLERYKDVLEETYTEEQKEQILNDTRKKKFWRILK
jgi:predicted lipase